MTRRLSALLLLFLLAGLLAPAHMAKASTVSYYALSFNGAGQVMALDSASLDVGAQFTIVVLFTAYNVTGTRNLVGKGQRGLGAFNYDFVLGNGGTVSVGFKNTTGSTIYATSPEIIRPGLTYLAIGRYDGTTLSVYVNGTLQASVSAQGDVATDYNPPLLIANSTNPNFVPFEGRIYLVLIYNRALSDEEIKQIYNDPLNPPTDGLILFYAPDSVDTVNGKWLDKSGNGNDGTIYGATYVPLRPISESEPSAGSPYELNMNASAGYFQLDSGLGLSYTKQFSIFVFAKPEPVSSGHNPLVTLWRNTTSGIWFVLKNGNLLHLGLANGTSWFYGVDGPSVHYGDVSMLGVVWSASSGTATFYYNLNSVSRAFSINQVGKLSYIRIGHAYYFWANHPMNGTIYEVLIYSRALNSSEIQQIYENPNSPPLDGLVLWYSPYTYDPSTGKWLNRAPIFPTIPLVEELDGVNYGAEAVRVSIPNLTAVNIENNSIIPTVDLITNITYNGTTVSIIPTFPTLPYGTIVQMNVSAPGYYPISFPVYTTTSTITAYLRPVPPEETPLGNATLPGIVVPANLSMIKNQLQLKFTQNLKDFFSTRLGVAMALMLVLAIAVMSLLSHRNTFVTISAVGIAVIYLSYYANAPWGVMWTPMLMWVGFGLWKMVGKGEDV